MERLRRVCGNCADFVKENNVCSIRYTITQDKGRQRMSRKPGQNGCSEFLSGVLYSTKES